MAEQETALRDLLLKVFDAAQERRENESARDYDRRRHDFVFHLTDCRDDLQKLADLRHDPGSMKSDKASRSIIGALYHTVPHLKAAGTLLLDEIPDPFQSETAVKRSP